MLLAVYGTVYSELNAVVLAVGLFCNANAGSVADNLFQFFNDE